MFIQVVRNTACAAATVASMLAFSSGAYAFDNDTQVTSSQQLFSAEALSVAASKLHKMNQDEVNIASWASERAEARSVKDFIAMVAQDHQARDQELASLDAAQDFAISNYQPANALERDAEAAKLAEIERLKSLSGNAFDREFIKFMIKGHKTGLKTTELLDLTLNGESALAKPVRDAKKTIQKHLKEARSIDRELRQSEQIEHF